MSEDVVVNYGPLAGLVGTWKGDKGMDVAPEPDGESHIPYFETITFSECGTVGNAETQNLAVLFYRQIVQKSENGEVFHDQTGYWMWDEVANTVIYSLTIPRAVAVLAGGQASSTETGAIAIHVASSAESPDWKIIESPFMRDNASTRSYTMDLELQGDELSYEQTTIVDIYGKTFDHTDGNSLQRQ